MEMLDWGIVLVILISTLISIWRGAIREVFSLASWVLAAYVGFKYNNILVPFFSAFTQTESLQLAASFLTLVILIIVIGTIIGVSLSKAINTVGLSTLDRALGILFGFARGVLIIAIIVMFASTTELPSQQWWKDSTLLPEFEKVANTINEWIKEQGFEPFIATPKESAA